MPRGSALIRGNRSIDELVADQSISYRAKGIYLFIERKVAGRVPVARIIGEGREGRDAIYAAVNELVSAGYLIASRKSGPVRRMSGKQWEEIRQTVLERDGHRCHYCGSDSVRLLVDHVVPLGRGGDDDPSNLVACCYPCNNDKNDLLVSEWKGEGWTPPTPLAV